MQSIKNYFKYLKVQKTIQQVFQVKQLHFISDRYFNNVIDAINSLQGNKLTNLKKIFNQLINKKIMNQKFIIRILLIIHEVLRSIKVYQISDVFIEILFDLCQYLQEINDSKLQGFDMYLKKSFSIPYTTYLIKAYRKQCKQDFERQIKKDKQVGTKEIKKSNKIKYEEIQMNFTIFNIINDILKLNSQLHQMGRYYSDHQYIINLFLQMLRDIELYYVKLKKSFNYLILLKRQDIKNQNIQTIYLFLSQSERAVNKMNSFYFNKYLYYYINDKISLNMELEIPQSFYKVLNKSYSHQRKLSFDYCLTASHPGKKGYLQQTKQSNRSKNNQVSKIVDSINSLNQILASQIFTKQILQQFNQQQQKKYQQEQMEKQNYLCKSTKF